MMSLAKCYLPVGHHMMSLAKYLLFASMVSYDDFGKVLTICNRTSDDVFGKILTICQ